MVRDTKSYEGFRGNIYKDTLGFDTVGYGHKLTADDKKSGIYSRGISEADATALYNTDRAAHDERFYKANPQYRDAPENVKSALEDMAYNMGPDFLSKFPKASGHLAKGNYTEASKEFLDSNYARQVGQRASDNAALIAGGGNTPTQDITFPQQQAPSQNDLAMERALQERLINSNIMMGLGNVASMAPIDVSGNMAFNQSSGLGTLNKGW